jgi:hypothetical protein
VDKPNDSDSRVPKGALGTYVLKSVGEGRSVGIMPWLPVGVTDAAVPRTAQLPEAAKPTSTRRFRRFYWLSKTPAEWQ